MLFDALLYPNRSLSPRGFRIVMSVAALVSLTLGGLFFWRGAWPVFGFCGLDILLLYLALRASYRSGRVYEKVRLTPAELSVEQGDHRGPRRVHRFQPLWLRVRIDDPPRHESQVELSSHGRTLVVGSFLSPEERGDFARALRAALDRLRRPAFDEGGPAFGPGPA